MYVISTNNKLLIQDFGAVKYVLTGEYTTGSPLKYSLGGIYHGQATEVNTGGYIPPLG